MLYDELAIIDCGEAALEAALLNGEKIYIGGSNEDNNRKMYSLENYLIKYYNHPKSQELKIKMGIKVQKLFNKFLKDPTIARDSCILSDENIVRSVFPSFLPQYKAGMAKLSENWEYYTNALLTGRTIPVDIKDRLMTFFSLKISFDKNLSREDKVINDKISKYVTRLLQINEIPISLPERQMLFNYCSRYVLAREGYPGRKDNIRIHDINNDGSGFTGGYHFGSYIAMNVRRCNSKYFYNTLDQMIQTICHETEHKVQDLRAIDNPDRIQAMEMAIQDLFGFREYHTGDNYLFNEIEEDANLIGYDHACVLYIDKNKPAHDKLLKEKKRYINGRRFYYEYVTVRNPDGTKSKISKEKYNVENIRSIVKNNPYLIKNYPVLTHLFNADGTPKSLDEMLTEEFVSHDINGMYTDFIIYDIRNGDLDKIDLSSKSDDQKLNIYNRLKDIVFIKSENIINSINDYDYRMNSSNSDRTRSIVKHHILDLISVCSFIEKDLTFLIKVEKEGRDSRRIHGYYYQYIKSLFNTIDKADKNHKLGNLEEIVQSKLPELKRIDYNLKREYIEDVIDSYYQGDIINTPIIMDSKTISLGEYIRGEVLNHMSREHYLYDNNGKLLVKEDGSPYSVHSFVDKILQQQLTSGDDEMSSSGRNQSKN